MALFAVEAFVQTDCSRSSEGEWLRMAKVVLAGNNTASLDKRTPRKADHVEALFVCSSNQPPCIRFADCGFQLVDSTDGVIFRSVV